MTGLITLIAEDQHFQVPRDVLTRSSLYFHAAFESGMAESKTKQFSFPNFTAHQLAMVVHFSRYEYTIWGDALDMQNNNSDYCSNCPEKFKILEALDLTDAADYFQMPKLIQMCVQRLSYIMDNLFQPKSIHLHESHGCDIFSTILKELVKVSHCGNASVNKLFSEYTSKYPHFLLRPCLSESNLQLDLINLVVNYLSKNIVCIPNEDVVLDIVLGWLQTLKSTEFYNENIVHSFLHCIRPGLLSVQGQSKLLEYWHKYHAEFKWYGKLTYDDMKTFFKSIPHGGMFSKPSSPLSQIQLSLLKPRAESLCLLGLAPNSSNNLEFWIFNLHNGTYHNCPLPAHCLRELDLDSSGLGDIDRRIYFCPLTYGPSTYQNSLFVVCFDPNSGALNGFAWCLATCRAKSIPRLFLSPSNNRNNSLSFFSFRSRRIGLTTLSSGLYMYYVLSLQEVAWLCAFRFDLNTWEWYEMEPYCLSKSQNGILLFTPIEQLSPVAPDGWLYANIETVSSSNNSRHPRHGLHQTSSLRSQLFRFRPQPDKKLLVVEYLPNPPFLIRMYRLFAITCSSNGDCCDKTYLFPMGTCSRDLAATHYCFDTSSCQWLRWSPVQTPPSSNNELEAVNRPPLENTGLVFNLCPKILGFRGLVCATHLLNESVGENDSLLLKSSPYPSASSYITNSASFDESPSLSRSSSAKDDDGDDDDEMKNAEIVSSVNENRLTTMLVLAGRPDQNKQVSCGIWFHHPKQYFNHNNNNNNGNNTD
uniref:BTB domain-containing protein n=1 Tax=Trichobilharzia regenti TaxID=157069 RepID=A0AA85K1C8_TRIRE